MYRLALCTASALPPPLFVPPGFRVFGAFPHQPEYNLVQLVAQHGSLTRSGSVEIFPLLNEISVEICRITASASMPPSPLYQP